MTVAEISVVNNFLDEQGCISIICSLDFDKKVETENGFSEIQNPHSLRGIVNQITELARKESGQIIGVKYFYTRKYVLLSEVTEHEDDRSEGGKPNGVVYSALLYLNENFIGGDLVFTKIGMSVSPKQGQLIMFPAGSDYAHKTTRIMSGVKYILAIFFIHCDD